MATRFQRGKARLTRSKGYTEEQMEDALTKVIESTARLRLKSGGVWSKGMGARVTSASEDRIPYNTLKQRFVKWMKDEASSPSEKTAKTKAKTKLMADAQGVMKGLEIRQLYNWTEYMRQHYTPATRLTLRGQIRELSLSGRGLTFARVA